MNKTIQSVRALINYTGPMSEPPRYHAMDASRNVHSFDPRLVDIRESRRIDAPSLDREGFQLVRHTSSVRDYLDAKELEGRYFAEICELIRAITGARAVAIAATPFVRFSERSA